MIQLVIQEKWFQLINTLFVSRDILEITGILRRSIQHCHTAIQQVIILYVILEYFTKFIIHTLSTTVGSIQEVQKCVLKCLHNYLKLKLPNIT